MTPGDLLLELWAGEQTIHDLRECLDKVMDALHVAASELLDGTFAFRLLAEAISEYVDVIDTVGGPYAD